MTNLLKMTTGMPAVMAFAAAMAMAPNAHASPYASGYNAASRALPHVQTWVQRTDMPIQVLRAGRIVRDQLAPRDHHFAQPQFRTRTTTPQYTTRRR